jgi:hypothetical protein
MEPYTSEDLTYITERNGGSFVVYRSPRTAEHKPCYMEIGSFPTEVQANAFISESQAKDEDDWDRVPPTA